MPSLLVIIAWGFSSDGVNTYETQVWIGSFYMLLSSTSKSIGKVTTFSKKKKKDM